MRKKNFSITCALFGCMSISDVTREIITLLLNLWKGERWWGVVWLPFGNQTPFGRQSVRGYDTEFYQSGSAFNAFQRGVMFARPAFSF